MLGSYHDWIVTRLETCALLRWRRQPALWGVSAARAEKLRDEGFVVEVGVFGSLDRAFPDSTWEIGDRDRGDPVWRQLPTESAVALLELAAKSRVVRSGWWSRSHVFLGARALEWHKELRAEASAATPAEREELVFSLFRMLEAYVLDRPWLLDRVVLFGESMTDRFPDPSARVPSASLQEWQERLLSRP